MTADPGEWEAFVAVAGHADFDRAAASLDIAVPELLDRVERLESALGVPLVDRDAGRFLGLTPAGWRLAAVAPRPADAAQLPLHTTLRIGVPDDEGIAVPLSSEALATLGVALEHVHPGVGVEPVAAPFASLVADLLAGVVDVVLAVAAAGDPAIDSSPLSEVQRVGLVGRSHPLAVKRAVPVAQFAALPMLCPRGLPPEYSALVALADVRPLDAADLREVEPTDLAGRLHQGVEVAVVPLALTANLPPELKRVRLAGCPQSWYYAQRRRGDDRRALLTAIAVMADFTESLSRAALR